MSKKDSQFFNVFSAVLGILVTIALCLFAFARSVGNATQAADVRSDARYIAAVQQRIEPLAHVAVAGVDNSALAIVAAGPPKAEAAAALPADGTAVYTTVCSACHGAGIAGAPKAGDKAAWGPRVAQGKAMLYEHALKGYQGKGGVMPAKGGRADLTDDLVKQAVDHLIEMEK